MKAVCHLTWDAPPKMLNSWERQRLCSLLEGYVVMLKVAPQREILDEQGVDFHLADDPLVVGDCWGYTARGSSDP